MISSMGHVASLVTGLDWRFAFSSRLFVGRRRLGFDLSRPRGAARFSSRSKLLSWKLKCDSVSSESPTFSCRVARSCRVRTCSCRVAVPSREYLVIFLVAWRRTPSHGYYKRTFSLESKSFFTTPPPPFPHRRRLSPTQKSLSSFHRHEFDNSRPLLLLRWMPSIRRAPPVPVGWTRVHLGFGRGWTDLSSPSNCCHSGGISWKSSNGGWVPWTLVASAGRVFWRFAATVD